MDTFFPWTRILYCKPNNIKKTLFLSLGQHHEQLVSDNHFCNQFNVLIKTTHNQAKTVITLMNLVENRTKMRLTLALWYLHRYSTSVILQINFDKIICNLRPFKTHCGHHLASDHVIQCSFKHLHRFHFLFTAPQLHNTLKLTRIFS